MFWHLEISNYELLFQESKTFWPKAVLFVLFLSLDNALPKNIIGFSHLGGICKDDNNQLDNYFSAISVAETLQDSLK